MKHTDQDELRVVTDIGAFLTALRTEMAKHDPVYSADLVELSMTTLTGNLGVGDALKRGVNLGGRAMVGSIRDIFKQHGVSL